MILEGKLCELRPICSNDLWADARLCEHTDNLNDRSIMEFSGISKTQCHTTKSTAAWIDRINEDPNKRLFGIFTEMNFIGNIRLDIDWIFRIGTISLAITNKDFHHKGIGTEAIQLISGFAFNDLMLHKLEASILDGNIASIKAFKKVGYEEEGKKRDNRILNGKYIDVILMGKINAGA